MVIAVDQPRFLQLADVAEILNCSASQVYALVRNKELPAVKIGGRGQWRVEASKLEEYIARAYTDTSQWIDAHPFTGSEADD
ncbi:MAG: hypothetical protein QOI42_1154 [Frankiaceae bacterium]|jgi:excisionase family DNA binding protein|nr:hypothetical protein [Frankiaceae bacterium]